MAYDLNNRFPPAPECCMLLDPGAYEKGNESLIKPNKAPFLARSPRITAPCGQLWTHAIYHSGTPHFIQNCSSIKSKCPRFPYEAFSKEDLETLLCRCGIQNDCACPTEEELNAEVVCKGKERRRLFVGPTPTFATNEGRKRKQPVESPPFYDARVNESTAFYHGCKWSKWASKRSTLSQEARPGPADYYYVKVPTEYEKCAEDFRSYRRQTSKQLRFIEMVQQRNILEGRPGPATYSPELPKGFKVDKLGSKSKRFEDNSIEQRPGPGAHFVKRLFDPMEPPKKPCHARLPEPSFFGVKAVRFKPQKEEGPSPATYSPVHKTCNIVHYPTTPFGCSTVRFKETVQENDTDESEAEDTDHEYEPCITPTWPFKSRTIRMKPLEKDFKSPSPADMPQTRTKVSRSIKLQVLAPFLSSEGRFEPWNDWMPVQGRMKTPGPCYYSLEKPKCYPAVSRGPLCRSDRFPENKSKNPSPNKYSVGGGVERVLHTHNQRLILNIKNKHTFKWVPPLEPAQLSYEEREALLLKKSIALLETDPPDEKSPSNVTSPRLGDTEKEKPTFLRCFV